MADFISDLAAKAGIDAGMAQKGVGALLSTLQKYIPSEAYTKVAAVIPNAGGIVSAFQSAPAAPQAGGLDLASIAGGFLGGKSEAATTLVSQFSKAGFSIDSAKAFLPVILGFLKSKVSPDTMKQIEGALPGLSNLLSGLEGGEAGGLLGKVKKMFS